MGNHGKSFNLHGYKKNSGILWSSYQTKCSYSGNYEKAIWSIYFHLQSANEVPTNQLCLQDEDAR